MKNIFLILVLFYLSSTANATIGITGSATGTGASNSLIFDISISNVINEELPEGDNLELFFQQRVRTRLPFFANNGSNFVPIEGVDTIPAIDLIALNTYDLIFKEEISPVTINDTKAVITNEFSFRVELRDLTGKSFEDITSTSGVLRVDFYILKPNSTELDTQVVTAEVTVETNNVVVAAASSGVGINAGDSSATVTWNKPVAKVDFYNAEDKEVESAKTIPSNVTVLLFERGVNDFTLDARLANASEPENDDKGECVYSDSVADGAGCISACDEAVFDGQNIVYLDIDEIKKNNEYLNGFIKINEVSASEGNTTFTGLTNDTTYRAVVLYEPNQINLANARCVSATPIEQQSIQGQFAGGSKKRITKLPCMITQASAGEWVHQELDLFRFVRDRWFVKAESSLSLVSSYYLASAFVEEPLKQSGFLRGVVYGVLEPVASFLKWAL